MLLAAATVGGVALWGGAQVALAVLDASLGRKPVEHAFAADTLVYDRAGHLVADVHAPADTRLPVRIDAVSPLAQRATIAVEDRSFYSEGAADPMRMIAAAWGDVIHRDASQGASTITMQLAKVAYLDGYSRSISFKLRELVMARRLEGSLSKQQILEQYLNDIPYGHGATGIQAAAHVYFGVDASRLDLAQSAMLAGLPNAPSDLDPLVHRRAARARQHQVLQAMVAVHDITQAQADAAAAEPLAFTAGNGDDVDLAPAFTRRVVQELATRLHADPYRDGLRVTTTLDLGLQQLAEGTVRDQVAAVGGHHVTDGALVSIDPRSGDIVAYVGSAGSDAPGGQLDMASHPRQPGSTFKLFTYATAIARRTVTMLTPVLDAPLTLPHGGGSQGNAPYVVTDYDLRYHGVLPVEMALGNSLNIPAVKVEMATGIGNVVHTARTLGVSTLTQGDASYGPSLTLGSYGVPLWQMAQAGGVLADGGTLQPARVLISARDAYGHELLPARSRGHTVIDPGVAYIMNSMLTDDSNREMEFGPHSALTLPGHVVAAKTGTTTDFRDNLTVGWTPHLVTATWVGNADNTPMLGTTGITGAAPMWNAFMQRALQGVPDDWPSPPPDVHQDTLDGRTGWFLTGTGPGTGGGVQGGDGGQQGDEGAPQTDEGAFVQQGRGGRHHKHG